MKNVERIGSLAIAALSVLASHANANVVFSDNFAVTANSEDVNFQYNQGRQGGSLAPVTYSTNLNDNPSYLTQVGHNLPGDPGNPFLLLGAKNNVFPNLSAYNSVSPNASLADAGALGQSQYVNFGLYTVANPDNTGSWASILIGSTTQNGAPYNSTGLGIIFHANGGLEVFDNGTELTPATPITTYSASSTAFNQFEIRLTDATTGNAYGGGTGAVLVELFENGAATPIFTYTRAGEFLANYVTLGAETDNGSQTVNYFNNLAVGNAVVPEPVSCAVLILGPIGLLARRRRTAN